MMGKTLKMPRIGSSAPITMMFGAVAIVIALLMFAVAAQGLIGGYERRAHGIEMRAREVKRSFEAEIGLHQEVENQTLVNGTLITLRNSWPEEVEVDYFAAISKDGRILYESPLNITLGPGESIALKPSELGLPSKYDGDFWLMRREVAYLQFHASRQGAGSIHPAIWKMLNATGFEIVNRTRTVTRTQTITTTTSTTTTITVYVERNTTITLLGTYILAGGTQSITSPPSTRRRRCLTGTARFGIQAKGDQGGRNGNRA